jgi:hypothetical protein
VCTEVNVVTRRVRGMERCIVDEMSGSLGEWSMSKDKDEVRN